MELNTTVEDGNTVTSSLTPNSVVHASEEITSIPDISIHN